MFAEAYEPLRQNILNGIPQSLENTIGGTKNKTLLRLITHDNNMQAYIKAKTALSAVKLEDDSDITMKRDNLIAEANHLLKQKPYRAKLLADVLSDAEKSLKNPEDSDAKTTCIQTAKRLQKSHPALRALSATLFFLASATCITLAGTGIFAPPVSGALAVGGVTFFAIGMKEAKNTIKSSRYYQDEVALCQKTGELSA